MGNKEILELEYLAKKYDETNIPLYLSYPTTSWWKDEVDEAAFVQRYQKQSKPFLYFHFPYCQKACYYCCCYKYVTSDESKKDIYIQYLEKEFRNKLSLLGIERLTNIAHMHWGGGTPTYMSCKQIDKVFNFISKKITFSDDANTSISIEAYPDDEMINHEKLKLLRTLGFNEISFGIQDFNKRIQKTINRDCKEGVVKKIINTAKQLGFKVHVDLCYGLPFQGISELEYTVKTVAKMEPDRIALFPYAHYPVLFPMQRYIPSSSLPNSFVKIMLAKIAEEIFAANGYFKVGIDHYVKKDNPLYKASLEDKVIKDFMGYSVEQRKYFIGFGNSAISFFGNGMYHNIISLNDYYESIDKKKIPLEKNMGHFLSRDDLIRNKLIQKSILCDFAIRKDEIENEFEIYFDDYFKSELKTLIDYEKDGLVESIDSNTIRITHHGKHLSRHIAYVFDKYYQKA